ncbi:MULTISPECIES: homoserine kinase [unclassified Gemella]|uniref:homoserine kinase n=1 Tax=unclassified Gemella TaxID=2624949 RepID=UPI0015D0B1BF|nr:MULTISPECIES: homoserine kinase [unclassified Gemella]MBF0709633.1 homoserine kinase [Gemella sp. GL1.1]NYS26977.1 homoserine kinase [Gemella sp. GL1]
MVEIRVPATSANVGCGFDSLGLALNLYTYFTFEEIESGFELVGFDEKFNDENNLVYKTFLYTLDKLGKRVSGVRIEIDSNVPVSRGLGSSSTCIVGGIYGAYVLCGLPLDRDEIFNLASEIEGHPDNVSPAIYGSLTASCVCDDGTSATLTYDIDPRFKFLALVPNFETSTEEARAIMPVSYSREDALYSSTRIGLILKAFENYDLDILKRVMGDKIHEPYRKKIIYEYDEVKEICEKVDSISFLISGSGSTLLNIYENLDSAEIIREKLSKLENDWQVLELQIDKEGTVIL